MRERACYIALQHTYPCTLQTALVYAATLYTLFREPKVRSERHAPIQAWGQANGQACHTVGRGSGGVQSFRVVRIQVSTIGAGMDWIFLSSDVRVHWFGKIPCIQVHSMNWECCTHTHKHA